RTCAGPSVSEAPAPSEPGGAARPAEAAAAAAEAGGRPAGRRGRPGPLDLRAPRLVAGAEGVDRVPGPAGVGGADDRGAPAAGAAATAHRVAHQLLLLLLLAGGDGDRAGERVHVPAELVTDPPQPVERVLGRDRTGLQVAPDPVQVHDRLGGERAQLLALGEPAHLLRQA